MICSKHIHEYEIHLQDYVSAENPVNMLWMKHVHCM